MFFFLLNTLIFMWLYIMGILDGEESDVGFFGMRKSYIGWGEAKIRYNPSESQKTSMYATTQIPIMLISSTIQTTTTINYLYYIFIIHTVAMNSTMATSQLIIDCCFTGYFWQFSSKSVAVYRSNATTSPWMEAATEESLWCLKAHVFSRMNWKIYDVISH